MSRQWCIFIPVGVAQALAATLAERVAERLQDGSAEDDGYMNAEAAGRYLCVPRRRIHELTSAGLLVPDGRDGRTPLYRRRTLDEYATRAGRGRESAVPSC